MVNLGNVTVKPVDQSPKGLGLRQPSDSFTTSVDDRYPGTPLPVVVQGRKGGPVERYRVASRKVCIAAKALGWIAVLAGAGELAVGVVVFNEWHNEGGWWGGILGVIVGVVATGITADTPVGTRLFSWLVWLSLLCFVTNLATVLSLDGPRYLETKDLTACSESFDGVCPETYCTCTGADEYWDVCIDFDRCSDLAGSGQALMASSIALLVLTVDAAMLFALGIKCQYFGGGVIRGGDRSYFPKRISLHGFQPSNTDKESPPNFGPSSTISASVHDDTRLIQC